MSYDIKLQNKCDHRINWESYALQSDLKTVTLKYPIAATSSVSFRVNNVIKESNTYDILTVRKTLSLTITSSIRSKRKIPDWQPLVEVQYNTFSNYCPKCLALKNIDDYAITPSGDIHMSKKEYLLLQTVEKFIVTKISSNSFHSWYGTGLHSLIGTKVIDLSFIRSKVVEQIASAIEKIKSLQKQLIASNREVDPGELFGQLLGIDVEQTDDPTIILVTVSFTSQSNVPLQYSQLIDLSTARERVAFA